VDEEGYGNAAPVEISGKAKAAFATAFHRPLEISQRRRDFHTPTARHGGLTFQLKNRRETMMTIMPAEYL
jgi:hypothetical protein